jgi:hypothetical protein
MVAVRKFRTTEAALLADRVPAEVSVRRILLTHPQKDRLIDLADGAWHEPHPGSLMPYDALADWGLIRMRTRSCQITDRGRRWLLQPQAKASR